MISSFKRHQPACLLLSSHVIRAQSPDLGGGRSISPGPCPAVPSAQTLAGWTRAGKEAGPTPCAHERLRGNSRLYWAPVLLGGLCLCKLLPHPLPPAHPKAPQVLGGHLLPPRLPAWPGGPQPCPRQSSRRTGEAAAHGGTGTPAHAAPVVRVRRRVTHRQGLLQPPPLLQLPLPALGHIPQRLLQTPCLRRPGPCKQGHPVGAAPEGLAPSTSPAPNVLQAGPSAARAPEIQPVPASGKALGLRTADSWLLGEHSSGILYQMSHNQRGQAQGTLSCFALRVDVEPSPG